MRILCLGDLHLRYQSPANRKDNYFQTQLEKLKWCFDLAVKEKCKVVIAPGDVFDSCNVGYQVLGSFLFLLRDYQLDFTFLSVYGQHDLRFHSSKKENTPLYVSALSGLVQLLDSNPFCIGEVNFYGASWGEDIVNPEKEGINVLVTHRMIIKDKRLWEGQENFELSRRLLREFNFDLIVSGDNHQFFIDNYRGKFLVNCGSLMRMGLDQFDYKPSIVIYDTNKKEVEVFEVPIKPPEEVFDLQSLENLERNKEIDKFVNSLASSEKVELNFLGNLWDFLQKEKIDESIVDCVKEILQKSGV